MTQRDELALGQQQTSVLRVMAGALSLRARGQQGLSRSSFWRALESLVAKCWKTLREPASRNCSGARRRPRAQDRCPPQCREGPMERRA